MSIGENKSDNYFVSNAITFERTWKAMRVEREDYMRNSKTSTRRSFAAGANDLSDFHAFRGKLK